MGRAGGGIGFSGASPSGSRPARAGGTRRPAGPSNHPFSRLSRLLAAVSTSVFIVAILILLLLLYHRDPMCCQFLCSCRLFQTPSQYVSVLRVLPLFSCPRVPLCPPSSCSLVLGLWGCTAGLPSFTLAGIADGHGSSKQSWALPPPCFHSIQEIHPSTHPVLPGCATVVVSPRPNTKRLPSSPHGSGGRFSSPCTVMCGVGLCFIGRGSAGKGAGS